MTSKGSEKDVKRGDVDGMATQSDADTKDKPKKKKKRKKKEYILKPPNRSRLDFDSACPIKGKHFNKPMSEVPYDYLDFICQQGWSHHRYLNVRRYFKRLKRGGEDKRNLSENIVPPPYPKDTVVAEDDFDVN